MDKKPLHVNSIDLNLLVVFQAIYLTRSVTAAGDRIGMTQSAVSAALKRLRERFDDPLFVRSANGMTPTPLAERLIGPTHSGLAQFAQAIDQGHGFDPATSTRLFCIAVNDIGQLIMMPKLLSAAIAQAPGVVFETVEATTTDARQKMVRGRIDLAMGSWEAMGPSYYQRRLFDETFVVLMRRHNPIAAHGLTPERYLKASHIAYCPSGSTDAELQLTLRRAGALDQRKVVLTAAHSLGLGSIVSASDLLLTAPSRLAQAMTANRADLRTEPLPFEVQPFQIYQQWHERFHQDSGNRWLRELAFGLFHRRSSRRAKASEL